MDSYSLLDPVEPLYDARIRGAFLLTTVDGSRVHMSGGCWGAPCSAQPPRMMVAIPKEFEGAEIAQRSGKFCINLTSRQERDWHDRFFSGEHTIDPKLFLRSPSGCPVPAHAVAYFDCQLEKAIDLGDFLLAIGRVTAAEALHPDWHNLSVNEIIATADPRGQQEAHLPYEGFDFDVSVLDPAPATSENPPHPARFEEIYGLRQWGLFFTSTAHHGRGHFHIGCWSMQVSHKPPRMAICFSKSWEGSRWVQEGAAFAMTLLTKDQIDFVSRFASGKQSPADYPPDTWLRKNDLYILRQGLACFICKPEQIVDLDDFLLVIAPVQEYEWLNKQAVNLQDQDLKKIGSIEHFVDPEVGFDLPR